MTGQRTGFDGQLLIILQRGHNIYLREVVISRCSHNGVTVAMISPIDSCLSQESLRF